MAAIFLTHVRGIPHLHESYTYYIVPICRLPRETSSSVGGSNTKLLLPVTWHRAAAIIYVHRTVVFRPRGNLVHLWQFQLYDARRVVALLKQSDANSTMCQESLFPMEDSGKWIRCAGGLTDSEMEQKKRRNRPSFWFFLCASEGGQGRRKTPTWPPVMWAYQNLLGFRGGTNPKARIATIVVHATLCQLDWACAEPWQTWTCRTTGR